MADIGTGSGAIAVTLATQVPNLHILATDISPAALDIAKGNAKKFKVEKQIEFVECDLLPANPRAPIHLLCANLPYIPTETLHGLPIYGREPTLALDGGPDGLDLYRKLLKQITNRIAEEYLILLEIENTQGQSASNLASQFFPKANVQIHQDLAGHDRLIEIQFS
ncbi:MAG: HemK family protein methyltransferase [Anaerolineales bacterium]